MASRSCSVFSRDGQFLAVCGVDGKLKIYETATNRLKQEYTPNLHLASPCSVIGWISVGVQSINSKPWKKRKRKSISEDSNHKEIISMGSTNGNIILYDVSASSVSDQLHDGHKVTVTALAWSPEAGFYSGSEDKHIVEWNLQERSVKSRWKVGKITSLTILPDGKSLLSGEKTIKWWDLSTKQLIATFSGHASNLTSLHCVKVSDEMSYLFSSTKGDNYINVWALNETQKESNPVASLALPDEAVSVSVNMSAELQIQVVSATASGQAQLFKYQINGTLSKPLKPALNILVASDSGQKESVQQIPIIRAELTLDDKILLAYGPMQNLNIEKITPDFTDKVQCLVRTITKKLKEKKEEAISKVKLSETNVDVEYYAPGSTNTSSGLKRSKSGDGSQLPLKDRLENLSLNAETHTPGSSPTKGENMAQLLIQGLTSKDRHLLATVLFVKKEDVIKNTVSKLPVQAIVPLLKELTTMIQGKTYPSKIAVLWLKSLISVHAAQMLAHPDIAEALAPIMNFIDAKMALANELSRLRGRVSLVSGQIAENDEKQDADFLNNCLLVYEDNGSSDDDTDIGEVEKGSESDDHWEEMSDQDEQEQVENGKSDDDASICS